jgi:hypothetical protein
MLYQCHRRWVVYSTLSGKPAIGFIGIFYFCDFIFLLHPPTHTSLLLQLASTTNRLVLLDVCVHAWPMTFRSVLISVVFSHVRVLQNGCPKVEGGVLQL